MFFLIFNIAPALVYAEDKDNRTPDEIRQDIIDLAMDNLGDPYTWGASGPNTSDCSGFVNYVLTEVGFDGFEANLGHGPTSRDQFAVKVDLLDVDPQDLAENNDRYLLPGDLLFLKDPYTNQIIHVGIYIGNGLTIEQGGLEHEVNIKPLSRWSAAAFWAGAGRVKTNLWPNNSRGTDNDASFDTDGQNVSTYNGVNYTEWGAGYSDDYSNDGELSNVNIRVGSVSVSYEIGRFTVDTWGGDKGVIPIVIAIDQYGPNSFLELTYEIIDTILRFAFTFLVLAVVYSGFLYLSSGGSERKILLARNSLKYIVVGLVILVASLMVKGGIQAVEYLVNV
jgi:hypothetical protein